VAAGAAPSKREARRLFEQNAVTLDGTLVDATTPARSGTVLQVGKRRWLRLT
jgi:tyrosyl-tRNA synthetase